jgi:hypothetical protein
MSYAVNLKIIPVYGCYLINPGVLREADQGRISKINLTIRVPAHDLADPLKIQAIRNHNAACLNEFYKGDFSGKIQKIKHLGNDWDGSD